VNDEKSGITFQNFASASGHVGSERVGLLWITVIKIVALSLIILKYRLHIMRAIKYFIALIGTNQILTSKKRACLEKCGHKIIRIKDRVEDPKFCNQELGCSIEFWFFYWLEFYHFSKNGNLIREADLENTHLPCLMLRVIYIQKMI